MILGQFPCFFGIFHIKPFDRPIFLNYPENLHRELLTLHYFGGLPLARVGELAGLSPGAAKTALCRARQRLRQIMEEDGYEV